MRDQPNQAAPYPTPESLPPAFRGGLPPQVQGIYFDAFTSAWQRYADYADREPFCHRLARSAVRSHQRSLFSRSSEARRRPVACVCDRIRARRDGDVRGGHEVEIHAIDVERRELRIVQSWGPEWGDHGYCVVSFDTFDRLLEEDGDVIQAVAVARTGESR